MQLKPPPIALRLKPFRTIEDFIADVNKFTAMQGYAVVKSGNKRMDVELNERRT